MSITSEINRIKGNISDAYDAVSTKGGTLPATQNSANLPAAILTIPSGTGTLKTWYNWSNMDNAQAYAETFSSNGWQTVKYAGNLFFALPTSTAATTYYTSSNGTSWTQKTAPTKPIYSVAYGNNTYVMTSNYNNCYYSSDAITWTNVEVEPPSQWGYSITWKDIAYGNGKFIAVSSSAFAISSDGQSWEYKITEPEPGPTDLPAADWTAIEYGNNKFVAIASNSNHCAYSSNGLTWSFSNLPDALFWNDIVYGRDKFVAIALSTDKYAYSSDGSHWTERTFPTSGGWKTIAYGQGKFVVFGTASFAYSTDGLNWTVTPYQYPLGAGNLGAFGANLFVCLQSNNRFSSTISFSSLAPCYTLEAAPTTMSTVYTEPYSPSADTITNVGTGTITLSNGYTYTYNVGGNLFTY